jgi:hypothetical protein
MHASTAAVVYAFISRSNFEESPVLFCPISGSNEKLSKTSRGVIGVAASAHKGLCHFT